MVPQSYVALAFFAGIVVGTMAIVALWLWVRLARIAGALARRRGYPRFVGIALGLLSGPLAVAAFALVPSRRSVSHAA